MRTFVLVMVLAACGGGARSESVITSTTPAAEPAPVAASEPEPPRAELHPMNFAGRCAAGDKAACACVPGGDSYNADQCRVAMLKGVKLGQRELCDEYCRSAPGIRKRVDSVGALTLGMSAAAVEKAVEASYKMHVGKTGNAVVSGKLLGREALFRFGFVDDKLAMVDAGFRDENLDVATLATELEAAWGPGAVVAGALSDARYWRGTHGTIVLEKAIISGPSIRFGAR